jgi:hypothetical protein
MQKSPRVNEVSDYSASTVSESTRIVLEVLVEDLVLRHLKEFRTPRYVLLDTATFNDLGEAYANRTYTAPSYGGIEVTLKILEVKTGDTLIEVI